VKLPDEIDLGSPADSMAYARAATRVLGKRAGDSVTMRGAPILFAFTIPVHAKNRAAAEQFIQYVISPDGRRILRSQHLDVLEHPAAFGHDIPAVLR
jgi:ABC-type molybdate transport system substrate-binding protein